MKDRFVIHPFLFGLFFVLALYSANVTEVSFSQVLLPLLVVIASTIAILILAWLLLKSITRAALLTSVAVILCFSYGHVVNLGSKTPSYDFNPPESGFAIAIWLAWVLLFGASTWFVRKMPDFSAKWTTVLNISSAVLAVMPIVTIIVHESGGSGGNAAPPEKAEVQLSVPLNPPDVYYIILDRYAGATTLQEVLDYDNSDFIDYLSDKGFYVATESRANYCRTRHSLASSLNMEFLDNIARQVGTTSTDFSPLSAMLQDYRVWRLFESAGYEFVHVGSWWEPTRINKHADININYRGQLPEFSMLLLRTTTLDQIGTTLDLWGEPRRTQWGRIRYEFERLGEMPSLKAPTFVFAHLVTPHPAYVFRSDGSFLPSPQAAKESVQSQYINQLIATNNMVKGLIDTLLAKSDVPPIIILQSDEGPNPDLWNGGFANPQAWTDAELKEKALILNAYYFPGVDRSILYPSITPVNSFRLVFNLYFGASLELLPDSTYWFDDDQPYKFFDATDRLG